MYVNKLWLAVTVISSLLHQDRTASSWLDRCSELPSWPSKLWRSNWIKHGLIVTYSGTCCCPGDHSGYLEPGYVLAFVWESSTRLMMPKVIFSIFLLGSILWDLDFCTGTCLTFLVLGRHATCIYYKCVCVVWNQYTDLILKWQNFLKTFPLCIL